VMDEELVLHAVMIVTILCLSCVALCCRITPRVPVE
jgi:hypothetical protein